MIYSSRGDFMKKDNDKLAYYLPIMISLGVVFGICFDNIGIGICLGVGAAGILSLFSIITTDKISGMNPPCKGMSLCESFDY